MISFTEIPNKNETELPIKCKNAALHVISQTLIVILIPVLQITFFSCFYFCLQAAAGTAHSYALWTLGFAETTVSFCTLYQETKELKQMLNKELSDSNRSVAILRASKIIILIILISMYIFLKCRENNQLENNQ